MLNAVYNGGKTLLYYLTPIAKILQEQLNYEFDVFQPDKDFCGLTIKESETILNHNVRSLKSDNKKLIIYTQQLLIDKVDIIFCNHQPPAPAFPDNVLYVSTNHGNAPMPFKDPLFHGTALMHNDVILCYGKASQKMLAYCIKIARQSPKVEEIFNFRSRRRKTYLPIIKPLKGINLITNGFGDTKNNFENLVEKYHNGNLVIGLLPTSPEVIAQEISLFDSINKLLTSLLQNFPLAKIILRPYVFNPSISPKVFELLNIFSANVTNFEIDNTRQNSNDFYQQCDLLISDGSTGGISFLLNKAMPPIYYIPKNIVNTNEVVNSFVEIQKDKVLFARNINELIKQVNFCINLTQDQRKNYFTNYCENDLFLDVDNKEVLQKIIDGKLDEFPFVDENGNYFDV